MISPFLVLVLLALFLFLYSNLSLYFADSGRVQLETGFTLTENSKWASGKGAGAPDRARARLLLSENYSFCPNFAKVHI